MSNEVQGRESNPFTHAPEDWAENGVPYGAFCKCSKCGYVGTSTSAFDYYAKGPGAALACELCKGFTHTYETEKLMRPAAMKAFQEDLKELSD